MPPQLTYSVLGLELPACSWLFIFICMVSYFYFCIFRNVFLEYISVPDTVNILGH